MRLTVGLGGLLATAGFGLGIVQGAFAQSDQPARPTGDEVTEAVPAPAIPMEQVFAQRKEATGRCTRSSGTTASTRSSAKNRDGRTVELYVDGATSKTLETEKGRGLSFVWRDPARRVWSRPSAPGGHRMPWRTPPKTLILIAADLAIHTALAVAG